MDKKAKLPQDEIQRRADCLMEKMGNIEGSTSKRMFGGAGIFIDGKMFAMVTGHGHFAMKTDAETAEKYEGMGAERFMRMPYHLIPEDIMNDKQAFMNWVEEAIQIALKK